MDVKMFQMNYGESILAFDDKECLLIYCGSRSNKNTRHLLVNNVVNECFLHCRDNI
jgi:hypothetical protein